MMSTRLIFRSIPGPEPSSLLWGEEWELYHGVPGSLYLDWHKRFGRLVAFSGAFGVSIFYFFDLPIDCPWPSIKFFLSQTYGP